MRVLLRAGHDTKVFMNSTSPPSKRSTLERTVDMVGGRAVREGGRGGGKAGNCN